jgi:hypothetical protein
MFNVFDILRYAIQHKHLNSRVLVLFQAFDKEI